MRDDCVCDNCVCVVMTVLTGCNLSVCLAQVGDQILQINNVTTDSMTHTEAIDIIQSGGASVHLLMKRTGKPPPAFGMPRFLASPLPPPTPPAPPQWDGQTPTAKGEEGRRQRVGPGRWHSWWCG